MADSKNMPTERDAASASSKGAEATRTGFQHGAEAMPILENDHAVFAAPFLEDNHGIEAMNDAERSILIRERRPVFADCQRFGCNQDVTGKAAVSDAIKMIAESVA